MDFDGDGDTDVLSGSFFGELFVFRRGDDGLFADPEVIENKHGSPQVRGYRHARIPLHNSTVFLQDWDGDGDGDLLVGRNSRLLLPNEGTHRKPLFGDPRPLQCDGAPIPPGFVQPIVADWDGDGRNDLLAGGRTNIVWYRNRAHKGPPVLGPRQVLVSARDAKIGGRRRRHNELLELPVEPSFLTGICVADFNGDGRPDLLLGDYFSETVEFPEPTDGQLASMAQAAAAKPSLSDVYPWGRTAPPENETRSQRVERYRKFVNDWREYQSAWIAAKEFKAKRYVRHGSVWFYERVALKENTR